VSTSKHSGNGQEEVNYSKTVEALKEVHKHSTNSAQKLGAKQKNLIMDKIP
jgi:hypothetical protein